MVDEYNSTRIQGKNPTLMSSLLEMAPPLSLPTAFMGRHYLLQREQKARSEQRKLHIPAVIL
jgi:hypothetical protein